MEWNFSTGWKFHRLTVEKMLENYIMPKRKIFALVTSRNTLFEAGVASYEYMSIELKKTIFFCYLSF